MKILLISNDPSEKEWLAQGIGEGVELIRINDFQNIPGADACIDLLFEPTELRKEQLLKLNVGLVLVHSVAVCLSEMPVSFVRINGWHTFLKNPVIECSAAESNRKPAEKILACFGKKPEWVPDLTGFITPRVISMIINEAYFALDEKVSTKEEIDLAMKLGTHYPFGPFEWGRKIGLDTVYDLLRKLALEDPRYTPCPLLEKEAKTI